MQSRPQLCFKIFNKIWKMKQEIVTVTGKLREVNGKKGAKALRRENHVPCVMYWGDQVLHFSALESDFKNLVYTPEFRLAEVNIDGNVHRCVIKDIQFHPVSEKILHVDLQKLVDDVRVKVSLPLVLEGMPKGVKDGGKLIQNVRKVEVKSLPKNLVSQLVVDVSSMLMGQSRRVRDIRLEEGTEILTNGSVPVAQVIIPRALRSKASKAAVLTGDEEDSED
jgi:large subunit ribosomal protein L25